MKIILSISLVVLSLMGFNEYGNSYTFSKYYSKIVSVITNDDGCKIVYSGFKEPFIPVNVAGQCLLRNISADQTSTFTHPMFWETMEYAQKGKGEDFLNLVFVEQENNLTFDFRFISNAIWNYEKEVDKTFLNEYCWVVSGKTVFKGYKRTQLDETEVSKKWIKVFEDISSFENKSYVEAYQYDRKNDKCGNKPIHRIEISDANKFLLSMMIYIWKSSRYEMIPSMDRRLEMMHEMEF